MLRLIGGALAGLLSWILVVTIINLLLRHGWPDYAAVEKAMRFTLPMMTARLAMSAVSSLASGAIAATIGRSERAAIAAGVVLLLLFVPQHYLLFDRFPIWYHLTFLLSLPLLSWLGGFAATRRQRLPG